MPSLNKALKNVSHVIFDMDGLLLDTETLYAQAFRNILERHGKPYHSEYHLKILGCNSDVINEFFVDQLGLPLSYKEFQDMKEEEMAALVPTCSFMPGAQKLVEHLHKHKIPIAVATSSGQQSFNQKTERHKDFFKLFNHIVMGSTDPDVKNGKPAPDIFLVCASRFADKPQPDKCLVFEDSPNGVQGAKAAGMQVVMVPDQLLDPALTKNATLVLKSLEDFKPDMFGLPPF
ncbi:hypothetical protein HHI36_003852 [Cryptolaemus montrouzieri]|uniref:Pseudouridine-5'-phosphatase n=1 Tax=Cryptolaemus montrouzieri TaxID=559131 RepID=A0ABD2NPR8_9CUCU